MNGRMVKPSRQKGWQIWPTPFFYRLQGLYERKRFQFSGAHLAWYNRPRKRKAA